MNFFCIFLFYLGCNLRFRCQSFIKEDIVVILDGLGLIKNCNFDKVKQVLKNMLDLGLEEGYDNKYVVVLFVISVMINFNFKVNLEVGKFIKQIFYLSGSINIQVGLKEVKRLFEDFGLGMYMIWLISFLYCGM